MISKLKLVEILSTSLKSIDYSVSLIPEQRFLISPPHGNHPHADKGFKTYFGDWSAARLLFHMISYERNYAVPAMEHWLGEPHPQFDLAHPDEEMEEILWKKASPDDLRPIDLIQQLRSIRAEQTLITEAIPENDIWDERLSTSLGKISFVTIVMKTIQHSFEHGNSLLKIALYWEGALEWLDRQEG